MDHKVAILKRPRPTQYEKTLGAMRAERTVKRINFVPSEANPSKTLNVFLPKLNKNEVIVPGSLAILFNIVLTGGYADNFIVQNVSRALVDKFAVKYVGPTLQDTVARGIYRIYKDLFLPVIDRNNLLLEGIQSEHLCKIPSDTGNKEKTGVDA